MILGRVGKCNFWLEHSPLSFAALLLLLYHLEGNFHLDLRS